MVKILFIATLLLFSSGVTSQTQGSDGEWTFRCHPKADLIKSDWPNAPYKNLFEIIVSGYCAVGMEIYGGPWNIIGPTNKFAAEGHLHARPPSEGWWPVIFKGKYDYQNKLAVEEVILVEQYKDDAYSSYKPLTLFSIKRNCSKNPWLSFSECTKHSSSYLIDSLSDYIPVWYSTMGGRIIRVIGNFPFSSHRLSYKDRQYLEKWVTQPPAQPSDLGLVVNSPTILSPEPDQSFESFVHIVLEPPPNSSAKQFQLEFDKFVVSPGKSIWETQIVLQGKKYPTISIVDFPYGYFIPASQFGGQGKWRLRAWIAGYGIPGEYRNFYIQNPAFQAVSKDVLKQIAGQQQPSGQVVDKSKQEPIEYNPQVSSITEPYTSLFPSVKVSNIVAASSKEFKIIELNTGQPVHLMIVVYNQGKLESNALLEFSITCKVLEGGPICPVRSTTTKISPRILPGESYRFRVLGKSYALAGRYKITVIPEGNPDHGLSIDIVVPSSP